LAELGLVADRIARTVFGLLFDSSPDAAFIVNPADGQIMSANLRAADLLALDLAEVIGTPLRDLMIEERELGAAGHYEDVAFRRGDGYPVYVELQVAFVDTPEHGSVIAYLARDSSERRALQRDLQLKHSALCAAHGELATRNEEIALLAWRAGMGELVAGIAHHLNNPVGALASVVRRLQTRVANFPSELRAEPERLLQRIAEISRRIESNVASILKASRTTQLETPGNRPELPPDLESAINDFAEQLDEIPTRGQS
jgi:PAS domain-containing protein